MGSNSTSIHTLPISLVMAMLVVAVGDILIVRILGSEFPERECCDPVYPIPAPGPSHIERGNVDQGYPEFIPTAISITTDIPGIQTKTGEAGRAMTCIEARDSCMNNTDCRPILEIVPRVCGAEIVACSTVTVTKCRAALRTLQAFPYFSPTCLCREPSLDPACNTFRDYLFEHPCSFVKETEKDPYPVDALPTCNHAIDHCRKQSKCYQLYRDFKSRCKTSSGICKMQDGELCHIAWTKLRMSPMFGCICPNNDSRCDRIFQEVNYNPCVDIESKVDYSDTRSGLVMMYDDGTWCSSYYHFMPPITKSATFRKISMHSIWQNSISKLCEHGHLHKHPLHYGYDAQSTTTKYSKHHEHQHQHSNHHGKHHRVSHGSRPRPPPMSTWDEPENSIFFNHGVLPAARTESHFYVDESLSTPIYDYTNSGHPSAPIPNVHSPVSKNQPHQSGSITVKVISNGNHQPHHPDYPIVPTILPPPTIRQPSTPSISSDASQGAIQSPIPSNHLYSPNGPLAPPTHVSKYNGTIATISSVRPQGGNKIGHAKTEKILLRTTCYSVMQSCLSTPSCSQLLHNILYWCEPIRCRQETCMKGLEKFYSEVDTRWALEVAFCLCGNTDDPQDQCIVAQEQLHPACAQKRDVGFHPSCRSIAEDCRSRPDCSYRLEQYQQACAVDSVTTKCAGPTSECRTAMLKILGTRLRSACACNGTDFSELYVCLGWQRILWVNPCVVESHKDYHRMRNRVTSTPNPDDKTSTIIDIFGQPTETESHAISAEGILGTDVISTTLLSTTQGNVTPPRVHAPSYNNNNGNGGNSYYHSSTTTTSSTRQNPTSPESRGRKDGHGGNGHGKGHGRDGGVNVSSGQREHTTLTSTTTTEREPTITTEPARYCSVHRPNQDVQYIREGYSKRLYREDRPTCSELCQCSPEGRVASCVVLQCMPENSCESRRREVTYLHNQPHYIAHRGNCTCYLGRFICEKPPHDSYTLYPGVFLFLGYSSTDEEALNQHTGLDVGDVVPALQELITPNFHQEFFHPHDEEHDNIPQLSSLNSSVCHLELFKIEGENIIINASIKALLPGESVGRQNESTVRYRQPNEQLLKREERECLPALQAVQDLVNKQHRIIRNHMLLSILKLAYVENNIPRIDFSSAPCLKLSGPMVTSPWKTACILSTFHFILVPLVLAISSINRNLNNFPHRSHQLPL